MRVLLTGMSGTGKSTLVRELRTRGCEALDADDDGFTEPSSSGAWSWRVDLVRARFDQQTEGVLYFAGCSEEQAQFAFDLTVLLTAPASRPSWWTGCGRATPTRTGRTRPSWTRCSPTCASSSRCSAPPPTW